MSPYNFFVCGPKFTNFFSPNLEGVVVLFRWAICQCIPEIFAIKVERCQKSRQKFDVFSPSQISGGEPSKTYTHFITPASQHVAWKRFSEDTPTSPEVVGAHMRNFKPNFKLSRLKFCWRTPVPVGVCAPKAWSICSACKNLRGRHPLRAEM